jgi:hypothetical protein
MQEMTNHSYSQTDPIIKHFTGFGAKQSDIQYGKIKSEI